jgi:catechol 2,3-dioxygenase-like lactoylglutathione lyase family enzyme
MGTTLQITIDCADPSRLVRFWSTALGYRAEPPPAGFPTWNAYYRSIGVAEDELDPDGDGSDRLVDPAGLGPRIWFQVVPEPKTVKNRLHLDLGVSGGRGVPLPTRRARVDAEVDRLVAAGATRVGRVPAEGVDHYGVVMRDPEGNEFCVH